MTEQSQGKSGAVSVGPDNGEVPAGPTSTAAYTVRLWVLRRLLGLAMIADGLTTFFTGWKIGVTLETAKKIGRLRSERIFGHAD